MGSRAVALVCRSADEDRQRFGATDGATGVVHTRTGRPLAELIDPTCWDFYATDWGMTLAEFLDHCAVGINDGTIFGTGDPLPGAVEGLQALAAAGHRLHIVTDRGAPGDPAIALASTQTWLATRNVPYTSLRISKDKTVVDVDVFIDDRVENINALRSAGTHAVTFHAPYNATLPGPRVHSWAEFVTLVDQLSRMPL